MAEKHIGSSFDEFLEEDGIRADVEAVALKRVLAWQLSQAMKRQHISKTVMARRMKTSRVQLDRLLDPENESLTLNTLTSAAQALGMRVEIKLSNNQDTSLDP